MILFDSDYLSLIRFQNAGNNLLNPEFPESTICVTPCYELIEL